MLRPVNKMQPSQSNWNFPDFPPVPLSKPELLKLTVIMKIEMYYLIRRQGCQFPPWSKKKKIFSHAYRGSIVTFLAWRYNSSETTGSPSSKYEHQRQTALLRNIRNIRICMGEKPIVSVTHLKCVLRLSCVVHGPIYARFMGFYVNRFLSRGPHRRVVTHILSKVSCFLLKSFHFRRLQKR